jgi:hypothetical protein
MFCSIEWVHTVGTRDRNGDERPQGITGNGRKVVGGSKRRTNAVTQAGIDGSILVDHQTTLVVGLIRSSSHVTVTVVTVDGVVVGRLSVTSLTATDAVARILLFVEVVAKEIPASNLARRRRSLVLRVVSARVICSTEKKEKGK